jgi:hypothetical protein
VSKLLEPDFWVTLWNKLLEPDFWVSVWNKLLEPDFLARSWKTFSSHEIAISVVLLLLLALYLGWKIKGGIDDRKIKGIKAYVDAANKRLSFATEQRVAGAEVELEVQRLRERLIELQTRFEAGAQRDELGMRFDVVAQMMAKLTSANDKLQRTFVQGGAKNDAD